MAKHRFTKQVTLHLIGGLTAEQLAAKGPTVKTFEAEYITADGELHATDLPAILASGVAVVITQPEIDAIVAAQAAGVTAAVAAEQTRIDSRNAARITSATNEATRDKKKSL